MVEVGIAEAQSTLTALLQQVQSGQEVVITSEGNPIARLIPATEAPVEFTDVQRAEARAAIERIRERAKTLPKVPFDWEEIKADRDFGRR